MIQYPVLLDTGEIIRDAFEMEECLICKGFPITLARDIANTNYEMVEDMANEIASNEDKEFELIADNYKQYLDGLRSEVEALAERLKSGKKGKGYTKDDIARSLIYACNMYSD